MVIIKKIKEAILWVKGNRGVQFIITVLSLYVIWQALYDLWLGGSILNQYITEALGHTSVWIFSILGFQATWRNSDISLNDMEVIHIGLGCTGLEFFGLFACFILAFPAKLKAKVIMLPLGILFIHLLNMIRVKFLIINYYFFNSTFDFNHKITFNVVVYGAILLVWVIWARKQMLAAHVYKG